MEVGGERRNRGAEETDAVEVARAGNIYGPSETPRAATADHVARVEVSENGRSREGAMVVVKVLERDAEVSQKELAEAADGSKLSLRDRSDAMRFDLV